jgi:tetrahydromethanopterin S-methyltransferase subunit A
MTIVTPTRLKKELVSIAGRLCEVLLPVKDEYYMGKGNSVAICTLSSLHLLQTIADDPDIMNKILIVGRLLSENRGIDVLISFALKNQDLRYIIVCGKEVKGHKSGQALLSLHKNGVQSDSRIIGAYAPSPFLLSSRRDIDSFRMQTKICDLIGIEDLQVIKAHLNLVC